LPTTPKQSLALRDVQGLRGIDPNLRNLLQALVSNQSYVFGNGGNPAIFKDQYDSDLLTLINGNATDPSKTITADYGIKINDHTIFIDSTSGDIFTTLPLPIKNKNKVFICMKISTDANIDKVGVTDDKLINGYERVLLSVKSSITVKSNGSQWYIISSTKDVDEIEFEEFLLFNDEGNFLFNDNVQFSSLVKGNN